MRIMMSEARKAGLAAGLLVMAAGLPAAPDAPVLVDGTQQQLDAAIPASPNITSEFSALVEQLRGVDAQERALLMSTMQPERFAPVFWAKGAQLDVLHTYIRLADWSDDVIAAVEAAGAEVELTDRESMLLEAWVPLDRIEAVAAVPGVRQLRRPSYGIPAAGTVTTEGDANLNTNFVRSIGEVTGLGVRVGVISVGLFNEFFPASSDFGPNPSTDGSNIDERVQTGNLPPFTQEGVANPPGPLTRFLGAVELFPQTFTFHDLQQIPQDFRPEFPEGAAILETIHDIAPGASLFYGDGRTTVRLNQARDFLIGRQCQVIVDNMVFFDAGRYDGTSTVSRNAQRIAIEEDAVYVVPSGNFTVPDDVNPAGLEVAGQRFPIYHNAYFSPRPGEGVAKFHNFAAGRQAGVRDELLFVRPQLVEIENTDGTTSTRGLIDVVIVWDDIWDDENPSAREDLDLYLFDSTTPDVDRAVAESVDIQDNSGFPIERITYYVNQQFASSIFGIGIARKNQRNSGSTLFTMLILSGSVIPTDVPYLTHGVPLNNADALPPVISVGAIDASIGINEVVPYSVPGVDPGPGRELRDDFIKWWQDQAIPAVVSYTNTRTLSTRFADAAGVIRPGSFTGTSAAAAHIGGLVALLRHAFPQIPSWQYYEFLTRTDTGPNQAFPNATRIMEEELNQFLFEPTYLRPNGFDTYANLRDIYESGKLQRQALVSTFNTELWEQSRPNPAFDTPEFGNSGQGLTLSPGGQENAFGFWQTPILNFPDGQGGISQALNAERLYAIKVRVGSDEADAGRVPVFRIRAITGGSDEAATLWVSGVHREAAQAPTSLSGKEYVLFYKPSNQAIAEQGLRVAVDLVPAPGMDKNLDAKLYLQDLSVEELEVPTK